MLSAGSPGTYSVSQSKNMLIKSIKNKMGDVFCIRDMFVAAKFQL